MRDFKTKIKTIGFTEKQYDLIVEIGEKCGFSMSKGKTGERGKFVLTAVKIAENVLLSKSKGEE